MERTTGNARPAEPASTPLSSLCISGESLTPAEVLRNAAYLLRRGAPLPVDQPHLRQVLAAVMDQEAVWAEDRGDRYPAATAPVFLLADVVRTEVSTHEGDL